MARRRGLRRLRVPDLNLGHRIKARNSCYGQAGTTLVSRRRYQFLAFSDWAFIGTAIATSKPAGPMPPTTRRGVKGSAGR